MRTMRPQEAFEVSIVRVSKLIYLPSALANEDAEGDVFSEFVDNLPERSDAPLYAALPKLAVFGGDDPFFADVWEVAERLRGTPGFLIEAETPVKTPGAAPGSFSYGWNHTRVAWLYAPDEASISVVCSKWADAFEAAR